MTLDELLEIWNAESDAANDIIVEILESYLDFAEIVQSHAELRNETILLALAKRSQERWKPILEQAKNAKKKAMENEKNLGNN